MHKYLIGTRQREMGNCTDTGATCQIGQTTKHIHLDRSNPYWKNKPPLTIKNIQQQQIKDDFCYENTVANHSLWKIIRKLLSIWHNLLRPDKTNNCLLRIFAKTSSQVRFSKWKTVQHTLCSFVHHKNQDWWNTLSKYTNFPIRSDAKIERVCLFRKETAVNDIKLIFFNAESKTLYNQHLLCSIYASFKRTAPSNEDTIKTLWTIKVLFFCKSTTFQYIFHYMGGGKKI